MSKLSTLNSVSCKSPYPHEFGFTLIEVMVALAIFTVAALTLTQASQGFSRSISHLQEKTLAHFVVMNEVAQIMMNSRLSQSVVPSSVGISSGSKTVESEGLKWQLTTTVTASPNPSLQKVVVAASLQEDAVQSDPLDQVTFMAIR